MSTSSERRSQRYGFHSVETMTDFFSKWIAETEIRNMIEQAEVHFRPRKDCSEEESHLQKIQKAEFAIVRRLVTKNQSGG